MPRPAADTPLRIRLLALPETSASALYGLYDVLASVGSVWPALTGEAITVAAPDVAIVGETRTPFAGHLGVPIAPQASFADNAPADIVIVSDLAIALDEDPRGRWPAAGAFLQRQFAQGATICSVCSGAVLLADAGLLDGLEATTHWGAVDLFRRFFPQVRLHAERILVPAGPAHRIVTSGGAASWEELALHLIARFVDPAEAVRTAKVFVLGDRSEGQLPFASLGKPRRHEDALIADLQAWIADHYHQPNPVARMAARSGLAERSLSRRFKTATGYAPVDYVQALRIEESKQLLERSRDTVEAIALAVGYEDPAFFRRIFKRRTGTSPARYRQRFQNLGRTGNGAG